MRCKSLEAPSGVVLERFLGLMDDTIGYGPANSRLGFLKLSQVLGTDM